MDKRERTRQFAIDMEMFGDYVLEWGEEHFDYDKVANALDKIGYRKIVWHKVADGDLPEYAGLYLVVCEDESLPEYDVDFYENYKDGKRWIHNEGRVIAWTELPTYKE